MRDTDLAFTSIFLSRRGAGFRGLEDVRGKRLAIGWANSAQAAILPLHYLQQSGLGLHDVVLLRPEDGYAAGTAATLNLEACLGAPDSDPHGEAAAIREVLEGRAELPWSGYGTGNNSASTRPVHCPWKSSGRPQAMPIASLPAGTPSIRTVVDAWLERLYQMDWHNPDHRGLMEMEWVHRWVPPETTGYQSLFDAVEAQEVPLTW